MPYWLNAGGVAGVILLALILGLPPLIRRLRQPPKAPRRPPPQSPPGPPVDLSDVRAWIAAHELDAAFASPVPAENLAPTASRLGGEAWLPDGEEWPLGRDGRPMIFVAQINFGELPPALDFPDSGLIQMFVADDDVWGLDFDNPLESDRKVFWRPAPEGRRLASPPEAPQSTPFEGRGCGLAFRAGRMGPGIGGASFDARFPDGWAAKNSEDVEAVFDSQPGGDDPVFVGGHPRFTQNDVREESSLADYDRVLLQIGYVPGVIMWGDVGEATWLIRREDLLKRDFSRVLFSWDCH